MNKNWIENNIYLIENSSYINDYKILHRHVLFKNHYKKIIKEGLNQAYNLNNELVTLNQDLIFENNEQFIIKMNLFIKKLDKNICCSAGPSE